MALYGLVWLVVAIFVFDSEVPDTAVLMPSRITQLQASLDVESRGGPPLLGSHLPWGSPDIDPRTSYYPIGDSDHPGIYLYLPLVGNALGIDDPEFLIKLLFVALFPLVFLVAPLVFYLLFQSITAGLVAPVLLLAKFRFLEDSQHYWIGAWAVLLGLPVLALVAVRRPRGSTLLLLAMCVLGGFASSVRGAAGVPLVVGAIAILLLQGGAWRRRLGLAAACAVCYFAMSTGVVEAAKSYRDWKTGVAVPSEYRTNFHSIYIGLGYVQNDYGITYNDSVAIEHALKVDPKATYLGPRYPKVMRKLVFDLARDDPGFIVDNLTTKAGLITRNALDRFWPALLLVSLGMLVGPYQRAMRIAAGFAVPALAVGFLPPVLVIPLEEYALGWLGAWGYLWLIGLAWLAAMLGRRVHGLVRHEAQDDPPIRLLQTLTTPWAALVGAALLLVAGLASLPEADASTSNKLSFYQGTASDLVYSSSYGDARVAEWDFSRLPAGWTTQDDVSATPSPNGLVVLTNRKPLDYQLLGPELELKAGRYAALVSGKVERGGLYVGVLDTEADKWLVTSYYWDGQDFGDRSMVAPFELSAPKRVQVILSNWSPSERRSEWTLRSAGVLKTP